MTETLKKLKINGEDRTVSVAPEMRVLDLLRDELGVTGTKEGCGEGECGACSIIVDGDVVNSCLMLVGQLKEGSELLTVEGLGDAEHLSPLQECFVKEGSAQCGICTPGMLMAAHALLIKNNNPTRDDIVRGLSGNLCRCTGYAKIIDAVEKAAKMMRGS